MDLLQYAKKTSQKTVCTKCRYIKSSLYKVQEIPFSKSISYTGTRQKSLTTTKYPHSKRSLNYMIVLPKLGKPIKAQIILEPTKKKTAIIYHPGSCWKRFNAVCKYTYLCKTAEFNTVIKLCNSS